MPTGIIRNFEGGVEIPASELDMNELFPGAKSGAMGEYSASCLIDDIVSPKEGPKAEFCLDIHGSDLYLKEIPQIRMNDDMVDDIMPYASKLNTDMVWIHPSNQVKEGSMVYELNYNTYHYLIYVFLHFQ